MIQHKRSMASTSGYKLTSSRSRDFDDDENGNGDKESELGHEITSEEGDHDGLHRTTAASPTHSILLRLVILLTILLLASLIGLWMAISQLPERSFRGSSSGSCSSNSTTGSIVAYSSTKQGNCTCPSDSNAADIDTATTTVAAKNTDTTACPAAPTLPSFNSYSTGTIHSIEGVRNGAVASDHGVCSNLAAHEVLHHRNGTAVDAAIVVALCLGVVNPASSGLGGGAFMLIHQVLPPPKDTMLNDGPEQRQAHQKKVTRVIECRERAPSGAHTDMYNNMPSHASVRGGLAIPVLAELRCLEAAHDMYGVVPWKELVSLVANLAEHGVPVGSFLAKQIHDVAATYLAHQADPNRTATGYVDHGMRMFLTVNDSWTTPLQLGMLYRNAALAAALHAIAVNGSRALYIDRADQLAREIQAAGGIVTADDIQSLANATILAPLVARHVNGYTLVGIPPPSSGGAAILGAVRFLSGFSLPLASLADSLSAHRIVEACKHVFAMRMSLSDPLYNSKTVQAAVSDLTTGSYMEWLRRNEYSDNATLPPSHYGGTKWSLLNDGDNSAAADASNVTDAKEGDRRYNRRARQHILEEASPRHATTRNLQRPFGYLNDHGTSHFSVVDKDGNAVSMTSSVNTIFGSHVMSASTGILFSNTMDDFSKPGLPNHYGLRPAESNYIMPGKRPLSSMSPTLVFRERNDLGGGDAILAGDGDAGDVDLNSVDLVLVIGASGGPKIITSVLQVLLNVIMMGQQLLPAVLQPRLHDQLVYHGTSVTAAEHAELELVSKTSRSSDANLTMTETILIDVSNRTRTSLTRRGHRMIDIDFSGTVQAIAIDLETNELSAVSDPRKAGSPDGY